MSLTWAMALLVLAPLAAAALSFALPAIGRWLALATVAAVGSAVVRVAELVLGGGVQVHRVGGWSAPLGINLRADGLAVLMLAITAIVGGVVTLYTPAYLAANRSSPGQRQRFWSPFLLLWTALDALFLSSDIFNLYVTLELLALAAVTLVALVGKRPALEAAMRYLFVSLAASLLYLLGVGLVYGQYATLDLALLAERSATGGPTLWVAASVMSGGLLAKAALFPMHFWLPPAHANAPAPVSALLSSLVVKGSFYILLRLWFEGFSGLMTPAAAQLFGALGAAAILWGSLNALLAPRLKRLVAYSTVAQLGYLFLLVPLAAGPGDGFTAWSGGLIFLGAHACAKAAMFLSAGNMLHAAGNDRIRDLDGVTHVLPLSAFSFGLSGMSLVGLPPSGGFAGKWLLLRAAIARGQWWWVATLLVGSLLAAAYVIRVLLHAFTRVEAPARHRPVPRVMEWTALGLAALAAGLGFAASGSATLLRVGAPWPPAGVGRG
jgi:formate hydrogenlyase subunit 3/multisubunit Na+/H+ antiporter MnhD subunit